jgi:hypothetical protein
MAQPGHASGPTILQRPTREKGRWETVLLEGKGNQQYCSAQPERRGGGKSYCWREKAINNIAAPNPREGEVGNRIVGGKRQPTVLQRPTREKGRWEIVLLEGKGNQQYCSAQPERRGGGKPYCWREKATNNIAAPNPREGELGNRIVRGKRHVDPSPIPPVIYPTGELRKAGQPLAEKSV